MSDEQDKLKISLEPPKLFGRKKKSDAMGTTKSTSTAPAARRRPATERPASEDEAAPVAEPVAEHVVASAPEPVVEEPVVEEPVAEELVVEEPVVEEPVVEEPVAEEPVAEEPVAEEPVAEEPVAEEPVAEEPALEEPVAETAASSEEVEVAETPVVVETEFVEEPQSVPAAKPARPAAQRPAAKASTAPAKTPARPRAKLAPEIEPAPITALDREDADIVAQAEPPLLALYPAAAVTGVVVGAAMVVLTWLFLRGCEAVRGTASCGGGPGFVLLVATFVVCILVGSTLLRTFAIPDPGSSSFLAVGLVAVISLLFLVDVLDHWSMLIVIPIISVGAYLASVWVTKTFVEPGTDT